MHFSRLYFKIFLAFIAVVIAAELVVYIIFVHGKPPPHLIVHVVKDSTRIGKLIKKELAGYLFFPNCHQLHPEAPHETPFKGEYADMGYGCGRNRLQFQVSADHRLYWTRQ